MRAVENLPTRDMDEYSVAPDSLEPHLGIMSKRFNSVSSSGNGEVFHCLSKDKVDEFPYFSSYVRNNKGQPAKAAPKSLNRHRSSESLARKRDPLSKDDISRASIQPKGLHTHVLNCAGLRPSKQGDLKKSFNGVFHEEEAEFIRSNGRKGRPDAVSLPDQRPVYPPHVCGKDDILQHAESSTSSDQDFPVSRVHYKKKVLKNLRPKTSRRLRTCTSRICCESTNCCKAGRDSEDSSVFSKSDSDSRHSSTNSRIPKVSISNSAEILYEESSSFKFIPPAEGRNRPLKSALKITQPQMIHRPRSSADRASSRFHRHSDDNYRKSFVLHPHEVSHTLEKPPKMFSQSRHRDYKPFYHSTNNLDDTEVYDPSLPVIPVIIPKSKSNTSTLNSSSNKPKSISSRISYRKPNSVSSGRSGSTDLEEVTSSLRKSSLTSRLSSSKMMSKSLSNLSYLPSERTSDLASEISSDSVEDLTMVSPTLGNWHDALGLTKPLGMTLLLYHAVRNNYKPLQFARQIMKVVNFSSSK